MHHIVAAVCDYFSPAGKVAANGEAHLIRYGAHRAPLQRTPFATALTERRYNARHSHGAHRAPLQCTPFATALTERRYKAPHARGLLNDAEAQGTRTFAEPLNMGAWHGDGRLASTIAQPVKFLLHA